MSAQLTSAKGSSAEGSSITTQYTLPFPKDKVRFSMRLAIKSVCSNVWQLTCLIFGNFKRTKRKT